MGGWEKFKIIVKKKKKKKRDKDVELKMVEEINQSIKRWSKKKRKRKFGLD